MPGACCPVPDTTAPARSRSGSWASRPPPPPPTRRRREADEAYRLALSRGRDAEDPLDGLARLSLATGKRDEALDYLRRYAVAAGDGAAGRLVAAGYYLRLERLDDACDLATRALEGGTHDAKAHRILGLVLLRRGDEAGALPHLERAEPDPAVLEGLIRAKLATGRLPGLARRLDEAKEYAAASAPLREAVAAG